MKVRENALDIVVSGYLSSSHSSIDCIFELETKDFDKAIQLCNEFGKKTASKEYLFMKEEFLTGEMPAYEKEPKRFFQNLRNVSCNRMSSVEARKFNREVQEYFGWIDEMNELMYKVSTVFFEYLYSQHQIEYHTKFSEIYRQKTNALNEWISQQNEAGNPIGKWDLESTKEIFKVLDEIGLANQEDELEQTRYFRH